MIVATLRNMTLSIGYFVAWLDGPAFCRIVPISRNVSAARSRRIRTIVFPDCFVAGAEPASDETMPIARRASRRRYDRAGALRKTKLLQ
jgi:hypothetical protein